ncbi:remorin 4.2 isoform X1 [Rosa rugosa]|uniref:remorin 4.2 isoform X1 n=1 Tax=Rosa rugosa TaxID=74645 RepID=UPI002B404313|nr:remorin 4.2 isoform X1 [Rosa rugosa]XP_062029785.1 remorin 4.2 isoform X1 [Rosa rugosa]XP_062029786.1 remorin 4.2 isoform X1 [Rosa rugosa]XP_062029787.1 remorin 4.2 isoform X1 [Rosa rugosa]
MDYAPQESEFATAVAAAAFAIHSMEQAELQYQKERRESLKITRTNTLQDHMNGRPSSSAATRRLSNKGANNGSGASIKRPMGQDQKTLDLEKAFPSRYPNRGNSIRPPTPADGNQNRKGNSRGHGNAVETKADAWEKAQMKKIQNRYEKVKAAILAWENDKKMQVKIKMERRKREMEQRRARDMQHYQVKQERIDHIAGGARAQVEQKRRNEESRVKEKVKRIRATGKVPVTCFCFTC